MPGAGRRSAFAGYLNCEVAGSNAQHASGGPPSRAQRVDVCLEAGQQPGGSCGPTWQPCVPALSKGLPGAQLAHAHGYRARILAAGAATDYQSSRAPAPLHAVRSSLMVTAPLPVTPLRGSSSARSPDSLDCRCSCSDIVSLKSTSMMLTVPCKS